MSVATPNMDQMVARLTQLSPQMLQQYAAQHQNDTMALLAAKAASDAQKKIMSAGKPQQMGIPPKVNEQVVESIAQPHRLHKRQCRVCRLHKQRHRLRVYPKIQASRSFPPRICRA